MDRFVLCVIYSNNFNNNKLNNLNYIITKYKFSRKKIKIQNLSYCYTIYDLFPYELY